MSQRIPFEYFYDESTRQLDFGLGQRDNPYDILAI
jgi:hypothetical protein